MIDRDTLDLLGELRQQLTAAAPRGRDRNGKEVSAKARRAVIDRGRDAELKALRFLQDEIGDADAIGRDVIQAIADHWHNLPRAAHAPERIRIGQGDAWVMDQLSDGDGRDRIGRLVHMAKNKGVLDANITSEAHIDRIERNRDLYEFVKRAGFLSDSDTK